MIRVIYGENRVAAEKMIKRQLGENYEVIEAESLETGDMASVFLGTSLFGETRAILVKDLSSNKACWDLLPKFIVECPHNVVIWETKLDKRSTAYKELSKNKAVEFKEFALAEDPNAKLVFDIFDAAMRGDNGAIKMCEKIEQTNDPYMFIGLMASQAIKKLQFNNVKAVKTLKILAQTDIDMKSTGIEPWKLVKMALLKISSL